MKRAGLVAIVVIGSFVAVGAVAAVSPIGVGSGETTDATHSTPADTTVTEPPHDEKSAADPNGTTVDHEGVRLTLKALDNRTVSGETDLESGSNLTVILRSSNGANPFLLTETVTVREDSTFAATFDMRGIANGTNFDVVVRHDDATEAELNGQVVGGKNDYEPPETKNSSEWTKPEEDHKNTGPNVTIYHDGKNVTVAAAANQTIRGETAADTGTTVTVRLESTAAANPFLYTQTATVSEDGTFAATFNMTNSVPGTSFEVIVMQDGTELTRKDGYVTVKE